MNYNSVFDTCKKQYKEIHEWMQSIKVSLSVLTANNSKQTVKNEKILKRIARIEEKLKIVNVEEPIPLTKEQLEEIEEGD